MPGFTYHAYDPTGEDRFRNFLSLAGAGRRTFHGSFTIASGDTSVAITGVGFQPEWVFIFGSDTSLFEQFVNDAGLTVGMAAGADQWAGSMYAVDLAGGLVSDWYDDQVLHGVSLASLASFDADGFTLTVTASPGGDPELFSFICGRGVGQYAVGTELSPASSGVQSVTCGFQPTAVFAASTGLEMLSPSGDSANFSFGVADALAQYGTWAGDTAGDEFTSQAVDSALMSFYQDADEAGPFQPALQSQGSFNGFTANGFDVSWNVVDGTQRYWSWFVVQGQAEVGRHTYNHSIEENETVPTQYRPRGLIFFGNQIASEGSQPDGIPGSTNAEVGIGACDSALSQSLSSYMEMVGSFANVRRSVREMRSGLAFGCYEQRTNGLFSQQPDNTVDNGAIIAFSGGAYRPQIYRRVFN